MDAQGHYQQQSVETASPAQLVSMLYHGAVGAIVRAEHHLDEQDLDRVNAEVQKAQAIVSELKVTIDHEQGGVIARNLDALYTFCLEQLVTANIEKVAGPLQAARETLAGLASAWDEMVAQQVRTQQPVAVAG